MNFSLADSMMFLVILLAASVSGFNFCGSIEDEEEVCGTDKRHIVCYPDSVPMSGTFVATAPMTYKLMRTILKILNTYRDKVASGSEGNFPKAAEMRQIIWNTELEYIAAHHANRCSTSEDECHSSRNFPNTAVISGVHGAKEKVSFPDTFDSIFSRIYEQASTVTNPDSFTYTAEHESTAADFSLIVNDQVSKVGCAIAYCTGCTDSNEESQEHCFFLTCVFDSVNVKDCGVYVASDNQAAVSCGTYGGKKSSDYNNLCTNNGKVYAHRCLAPPESRPPSSRPPGSKPPGSKPPGSKPPESKPPESKPPESKPPESKPPESKPPESKPPESKPSKPKASAPHPQIGIIPPIEDDRYSVCPIEKPLCAVRPNSKHYVCHPDLLPMFGVLETVFRFSEEEKREIEDFHNQRRSEVASGIVGSNVSVVEGTLFQKAARMRELKWDDELEYIAEKHARRCHFEHDKCRNTKTYRLSGQNLGYVGSKTGTRPPLHVMETVMKAWFAEHNFVQYPIERTDKYDDVAIQQEKSGHYIQMMIDQMQKIGCSIVRCINCTTAGLRPFCFHISCHHDMTGVPGYGVYKPGPPTSKCSEYNVGKSEKYENLCATGPLVPYTIWNDAVTKPITDVVEKIPD